MVEDTYLMHYGVKGMKWGVRRLKPSTGDSRGNSQAPSPSKPNTKRVLSKKAKIAAGAAVATASAAIIDQVAFKGAGRKFVAAQLDDLWTKTIGKAEYDKGYELGRAYAAELDRKYQEEFSAYLAEQAAKRKVNL